MKSNTPVKRESPETRSKGSKGASSREAKFSHDRSETLEIRELLCQVCNADYPVWFAPNDLWNRVMRLQGYDKYQFVCLNCFAKEAESIGIKSTAWKLTMEEPAHTPDTKAIRQQLINHVRFNLPEKRVVDVDEESDEIFNEAIGFNEATRCPAYSLGYLLRKLPAVLYLPSPKTGKPLKYPNLLYITANNPISIDEAKQAIEAHYATHLSNELIKARIDEALSVTHFCTGGGFQYVRYLENGDKEFTPLDMHIKELEAQLNPTKETT